MIAFSDYEFIVLIYCFRHFRSLNSSGTNNVTNNSSEENKSPSNTTNENKNVGNKKAATNNTTNSSKDNQRKPYNNKNPSKPEAQKNANRTAANAQTKKTNSAKVTAPATASAAN